MMMLCSNTTMLLCLMIWCWICVNAYSHEVMYDDYDSNVIADWVWLGALTSSSIRINVGLNVTTSSSSSSDATAANSMFSKSTVQLLVESFPHHNDNNSPPTFSKHHVSHHEILIDPPIIHHHQHHTNTNTNTKRVVENRILHFYIQDLPYPNTNYRFQLQFHPTTTSIDNNNSNNHHHKHVHVLKQGSFQTLQAPGDHPSHNHPNNNKPFTFAFSSCMNAQSNDHVFHHMITSSSTTTKPDLFIHLGDLHYDNINQANLTKYRWSMWHALAHTPAGTSMLQTNIPMAYMYDDHDFNDNNCDKYAPGKYSALQTYQEFVPHYPFPTSTNIAPTTTATTDTSNTHTTHDTSSSSSSIIYQSFVANNVLFILTDLQSQKTPDHHKDDTFKSVLGVQQKQWFRQLLQQQQQQSNDRMIQLIVWCSTMPWIDDERKWGHYTTERDEIISMVQMYNLSDKFIIISGDAHMIAVDDGTYSYGNIPVFQAAALGRNGKVKGGPYSHGVFPGNGQYGTIQVSHNSQGQVCLQFTGHRVLPTNPNADAADDANDVYDYNHTIVQTYNTCTKESLYPDSLYIPPPIYMRKIQRFLKRRKKSYKRFMKTIQRRYPHWPNHCVTVVPWILLLSILLIVVGVIRFIYRFVCNSLKTYQCQETKDKDD